MSKQVTITLNQIKSTEPSEELWKKLLKVKGGTSADYNKPFPLSDVLGTGSLFDTIKCFYCLPEHKKVFMEFALFCAKSANMYACDPKVHECITKTEKCIEDNGSRKELLSAINEASNGACISATAAVQVAKYVLASLKDIEVLVYPTAVAYASGIATRIAYDTGRFVPDIHAYGAPTFICKTLSAHTARSREAQKQTEYLRELLDREKYIRPKTYKSQLKTWLETFLIKFLRSKENKMENLKKLALAQHLQIDTDCIEDSIGTLGYDNCTFETDDGEYLVLTEEEAEDRWEESLDSYIEECLEIPEHIRNYFDEDAWKADARMDGRGHSLSSYDGVEYTETVDDIEFYIFRTN